MKYAPIYFALIIVSACTNKIKNTESEGSSIASNLQSIFSKTDSAWALMIKSDDNKIQNLKRLTKELQLIEGSSESGLNKLSSQIDSLNLFRYSRISMQNSFVIDLYDSVTNKAIFEVKKQINQNKNATKYQLVNQLISEIQAADDSVLQYRKAYDHTVDGYNKYLKVNRKNLKRNYPGFDTLKKYSVFRLFE